MNEFNEYLTQLQQALNRKYETLSPAEQDEILAEIESHIEEGHQDPRMGSPASREANLLAELDSPTKMADGLHHVHHSNRWVLFILIPPAIRFLIHSIGWEINIPDLLHIPIVMMFPIYLLSVLFVCYREAANRDSRRDKQAN